MLTQEQLEAAKIKAKENLHEKEHKAAVECYQKQLLAKRGHFFPKKIVFQWPIRFEDWYKVCSRGKCR